MGILWPHSNSTVFNAGGTRAAGAKLYFFESGTLTPRTTYSDAALTTPRTHPVVADGYGRAPAIFLDFGDYRERVRTSGDVTIWDTDAIPNPTPLTEAAVTVPETLLQTGQFIFEPIDTTRAGFVRANGRTMGSATSGGAERANADTSALYTYLYNALSDAAAPVSGGRGANAAADFSANKTITLPDMRGRGPVGLDTMGNSAASRFDASVPFTVGNSSTAGSVAGQNHHIITTAQVPSHAHTYSSTTGAGSAHTHGTGTFATVSNGAHTHTVTITDTGHTHGPLTGTLYWVVGGAGANQGVLSAGADSQGVATTASATTGITAVTVSNGAHTHTFSGSLADESAHTHTYSGTVSSVGSDAAHNNLPGAILGTWYIKL